jgi:hypothetical protein
MNNTAWKAARERAAGVSFEDRQDLLGNRSGRITTHYSQAELTNLIASKKVCDTDDTLVRSSKGQESWKFL